MFKFLQDDKGTAMVEYSLLVSLIGLGLAGTLHVLGGNLLDVFSSVSEEFGAVIVTNDPPLSQ